MLLNIDFCNTLLISLFLIVKIVTGLNCRIPLARWFAACENLSSPSLLRRGSKGCDSAHRESKVRIFLWRNPLICLQYQIYSNCSCCVDRIVVRYDQIDIRRAAGDERDIQIRFVIMKILAGYLQLLVAAVCGGAGACAQGDVEVRRTARNIQLLEHRVLECGDSDLVRCRRGGHGVEGRTQVHIAGAGRRKRSRWERMWRCRRNAVEAVISAMKRSNRLDRNHLLGREGDRINAILSACGYNLRKLLRELVAIILRPVRLPPACARLLISKATSGKTAFFRGN